jgi:hypothetical protein
MSSNASVSQQRERETFDYKITYSHCFAAEPLSRAQIKARGAADGSISSWK